MNPLISIETPGKTRHNTHRRTIAEALHRLSQKPRLDNDVKNLNTTDASLCQHQGQAKGS
ncbi:MAG: hypothetical protein GY832_05170 [Chloroflexi bacterium]|nr:hypothetical protein [Chloroflexota bacterium]